MAAPVVTAPIQTLPADWRDFFALTKPRVMSLVIFTALCGLLASGVHMPFVLGFTAILAIALGAGASGALNQWYEAEIDAKMKRTSKRPLPDGRMEKSSALHFGVGLSVFSVALMGLAANWLAAAVLAGSILFYVVIYTIWLKPRTPQNIVIGGAAGAFPPMIGWAAATGDITWLPFILFLLIFFWTPPHFWSLALFVRSDYANAGIPMMPVVAGHRKTRNQIVLYTLIMSAIAIAPWPLGLTGWLYGVTATVFSVIFTLMAVRVGLGNASDPAEMRAEKRLFGFSVLYLFTLFAVVAVDRLLLIPGSLPYVGS